MKNLVIDNRQWVTIVDDGQTSTRTIVTRVDPNLIYLKYEHDQHGLVLTIDELREIIQRVDAHVL